MLRIAQCTDTFLPVVDGVGRVVLAYAETLSRMGHEVTVSCPMYDTGSRGGYPFEIIDYTAFKVPTAPQYKTGAAVLDSHYKKRIGMIPLDIVHAHSPFGAGYEALRLARERRIPLVVSFHSKYYDDFYKATKSKALSKIALRKVVSFYHRCNEVWAVSESTAEVLKQYGYQGPVRVMPNGVTLREPRADMVRRIEEQHALGNLPLLLFVGQINWKKNILRVLEAAVLLRDSGTPFMLLLAGQGPDRAAVQEKIVQLGLSNHAKLIGHIKDMDELDALYARASVFTFPSLYDNAPMVVREAAVMGTPAVLVADSDAAEIIHDGVNGFLCRDDSADLYQVLKEALSNPEWTRKVGISARETIPQPWETIIANAVEAYRELIASGRSPGPRRTRRAAAASRGTR